jgi:hypothetical protein
VYVDYTCQYSYRALLWLDRVAEATPDLEIHWATFSLKEVNRSEDEPSWLEAGSPPSVSVLALALAHAARGADFARFHHSVFDAMQGQGLHVGEPELLAMARDAGVDVDAFERDRGSWVAKVGDEHRDAVDRLGVFGTPTLVLGPAAAYLRLGSVPDTPAKSAELLAGLHTIADSPAGLVELTRPEGPKLVHHSLPVDQVAPQED